MTNPTDKDKLLHLLRAMITSIVDNETAVKIDTEFDQLVKVTVDPRDYPRLMGAHGANINGIRNIFASANSKLRCGLTLFIVDPNPAKRGQGARDEEPENTNPGAWNRR